MSSAGEMTLDVARRHDMTTGSGSPGSIEVPLLSVTPGNIRDVLALHERAAAGTAADRGQPLVVDVRPDAAVSGREMP